MINSALDEAPILTYIGKLSNIRSETQMRGGNLPRIVWTFWDSEELPEIATKCLLSWQRNLSDHDINLISLQNLKDYCPVIPDQVTRHGFPKLSDWVRLELLATYGGIWMDTTTLLLSNLDFVHRHFSRFYPDFLGFYNETRTLDTFNPMIENSFMAAPKGSPFIDDLRQEYSKAVMRGHDTYVAAAVEQMHKDTVLQGFPQLGYFSQHVALQIIIRRPNSYAFSLIPAEKGPFLLPHYCNWNASKISQMLLTKDQVLPKVHLVKLTSKLWRQIEDDMMNGMLEPQSTIGRFI